MMTNTLGPRISVVIPTFNRAKTIAYCIDSVLNQTYPAHEIIVVDDCSTDNIQEIVSAYNNPLIKFLTLETKGGAQAARNLGIKSAQGNWIAFQDSDDEWKTDKLAKQVNALKDFNFDENIVVHTDCVTFIPSQNKFSEFKIPCVDGKSSDIFKKLLYQPAPLFPTILASKRALEKIDLLDTNILSYQEWDTTIRLAKFCRFVHLKEPLFVYHLHDGTTISKNLFSEIRGYYAIRRKFKKDIIKEFGSLFFHLDLLWIILRAVDHNFLQLSKEIVAQNFSRKGVWDFVLYNLHDKKNVLTFLIKLIGKTKSILVKSKL